MRLDLVVTFDCPECKVSHSVSEETTINCGCGKSWRVANMLIKGVVIVTTPREERDESKTQEG